MNRGATRILTLQLLDALPEDRAGDRTGYARLNMRLVSRSSAASGRGRDIRPFHHLGTRGRVSAQALVSGLRLLGTILVSALPRKASDEAQRELLRFEALAAELTTRLAGAPGDRVDMEVDRGLEQILAFFDVDICGIFDVVRDKKQSYLRHVAGVPGIPLLSTTMDYARAFPWKSQCLVRFGKVFAMNRVSDFPAEATVDRESIQAMGIRSSLDIPIRIGGQILHVFGLGCSRRERTWPEEYIPRLRLLGQAFASALSRARGEEALRRTQQMLAAAQRIAQTGSYERELATDAFTASTEAGRIFGVQPGDSMTFLSSVHPQDRAKVKALFERLAAGTEETYSLEYRIVRPDGEMRVIRDEGQVTSPQHEGTPRAGDGSRCHGDAPHATGDARTAHAAMAR